MPKRIVSGETVATWLGIAAILLWCTVVGVSRSLTEQLGPLTSVSCIYLIAGALGSGLALAFRGGAGRLVRMPRRYLLGCGGLFALYGLCLYLALGMAAGRQQVLEIGIVNYLWPALTLVFSIPILGMKARPWLVPAMALVLGGIVLAMAQGGEFSWSGFLANLRLNGAPYLLALAASVAWGLYSNLSRRWAGKAEGEAVPFFLLAAGVILLLVRLTRHEDTQWSWNVAMRLAYMAIGPTLLAYTFWDYAMRKGRMVLVTSVGYTCPVLSTFVTGFYLGVGVGPALWVAAAMVVAGAMLSNYSIVDPARARRV
ncbi:MAG: aromatic amino acid DMT transporter YddG [Planctomycetes bacterium]|nr:aromatic amino acid DMT transporter YddG [Planctomycetota bacterium]